MDDGIAFWAMAWEIIGLAVFFVAVGLLLWEMQKRLDTYAVAEQIIREPQQSQSKASQITRHIIRNETNTLQANRRHDWQLARITMAQYHGYHLDEVGLIDALRFAQEFNETPCTICGQPRFSRGKHILNVADDILQKQRESGYSKIPL